ncbi:MAG: helix-turn-helix domain-containing protein [Planctomycetes bacterium]|nr:helix-turn-helix domain-containing protein [Planctomycetota bacterium]
MNHIGRILRAVREARGLTREVVAYRLGYGSVRKGTHKLAVIEATGKVKSDLLVNLLEVLALDLATFEDLAECLYLTGRFPPIPSAVVIV